MTLCEPCQRQGREQKHHHFRDFDDGRGPIPVCRWHFKDLPYPASREVHDLTASAAMKAEAEGTMTGKSEVIQAQLRDLHNRGMSDQEIKKALGCSVAVVGYHRRALGLTANKPHSKAESQAGRVSRAAIASAGEEFHRIPKAKSAAIKPASNGRGHLVSVRVEVLDAMWAGLEPEDKARLVNHLIEAR